MLKKFDKISDMEKSAARVCSNFHTHNYLCGHAGGTVSDYAREAVRHGFKSLGVSDHCKPPPPVRHGEPYVDDESLDDDYLPQFAEARKLFPDLEILSAVEVEYFMGNDDYYKTLLSKLDYLVLGQHEFLSDGVMQNTYIAGAGATNVATYDDIVSASIKKVTAYADHVVSGIESGLFAIVAHPDLIFYSNPHPSRAERAQLERIVKAAAKRDIPLELNANGIRHHQFRYPTDILVSLCKKHRAKMIISSDAHSPDFLCDDFVKALYAYAQKYKLDIVRDFRAK